MQLESAKRLVDGGVVILSAARTVHLVLLLQDNHEGR